MAHMRVRTTVTATTRADKFYSNNTCEYKVYVFIKGELMAKMFDLYEVARARKVIALISHQTWSLLS